MKPPDAKLPAWLICLALALGTFALYQPVAHHEFVSYDDPDYVLNNPQVRNGLSAEGIVSAFTKSHAANWHPLTWLSHMLDAQLFGLIPGAHHLVSVAFHAANAALLFLLLQQLTGATWRSALVAALFAWHPLRVESVAWISERKDVLSGCFWILTLMAYVRYVRTGSRRAYIAATTLFACGLMAKPMVVTLPFVLLLLDCWPLQRMNVGTNASRFSLAEVWASLKPLIIEKAPFFALALAACIITLFAQSGGGAVTSSDHLSLLVRGENAVVSYARYLGKTLVPANLTVFYPHPIHWPQWQIAGSVLILMLGTWVAHRQFARRPYLCVGWLWFLGTLVPVIGLVQVGGQSIANRYTYLPSIGLFIAAVWWSRDLANRSTGARQWMNVATMAFVAACWMVSRHELRHWQSTETLFRHALVVSPNNLIARVHLGNYLARRGANVEALQHLQAALVLRPSADLHNNLALVLVNLGRLDEAATHCGQALKLDPTHANAQRNQQLLAALQAARQRAVNLNEQAAALAEKGRVQEAVILAEQALALAVELRDQTLTDSTREQLEHYRVRAVLTPTPK
jgi:hypothetical protein